MPGCGGPQAAELAGRGTKLPVGWRILPRGAGAPLARALQPRRSGSVAVPGRRSRGGHGARQPQNGERIGMDGGFPIGTAPPVGLGAGAASTPLEAGAEAGFQEALSRNVALMPPGTDQPAQGAAATWPRPPGAEPHGPGLPGSALLGVALPGVALAGAPSAGMTIPGASLPALPPAAADWVGPGPADAPPMPATPEIPVRDASDLGAAPARLETARVLAASASPPSPADLPEAGQLEGPSDGENEGAASGLATPDASPSGPEPAAEMSGTEPAAEDRGAAGQEDALPPAPPLPLAAPPGVAPPHRHEDAREASAPGVRIMAPPASSPPGPALSTPGLAASPEPGAKPVAALSIEEEPSILDSPALPAARRPAAVPLATRDPAPQGIPRAPHEPQAAMDSLSITEEAIAAPQARPAQAAEAVAMPPLEARPSPPANPPPQAPSTPLVAAEVAPLPQRASEAPALPPGAPPSSAPHPVPIRQIAPIAVALAFSPGGAGGFQLSLDPAELGRVEIRVQREGETHAIRIVAERPETLALLLRDRQELDRGLADAGLRVEAKGIEFSLGTSSGQGEQRPQAEPRGAAPQNGARAPGMPKVETIPARVQRGLIDLNI